MLRLFLALCALLCLLSACQKQAEEELTILFTGDVLLDRGVRPWIQREGTAALFQGVEQAFREADAVVINLECPLTNRNTPVSKKFVFRGEPEWADGLRQAGVTHAALANNHMIDQGRQGLADTYHALLSAGIIPLGYGLTTEEQLRPTVVRKGRTEVALFNSIPLPIENWVHQEGQPGVCQASIGRLAERIRDYKNAHPDAFAVAILHWGTEFQPHPDMQQRYDAHRLVQAGADAVIGHHPHVLQPCDTLSSSFVFYSLGNFVFDTRHPASHSSMMAVLHFSPAGLRAESIPVKVHRCRPQICGKAVRNP